MLIENNKIIASEGKILRRISDQLIFGNEIYLGYTYSIGGETLDEPLLELPEHFEEIDEVTDIVEEDSELIAQENELEEQID